MNPLVVTIIIYTGYFLLGCVALAWGVVLPELATELHMSDVISGSFFTIFSFGMVAGAFLGGKYIQRFPFMRLFAVLAWMVCGFLMILSWVSSWQLLLILSFIIGTLNSIMFTIGHTLTASLHARRRSTMMGLGDFAYSLGTMAVPFLVTGLYLLDLDWRWPIRVLGAGLALMGIWAWLNHSSELDSYGGSSSKQHGKTLSYGPVLSQPVFLLMALAMFSYGAVEWGNGNWFVSYAQNGVGMDGEAARYSFAFFTGGMVLSRLGFIFLLRIVNLYVLMIGMAILAGVGGAMLKLADSTELMQYGNFMLGLGLGGLFPLILSNAMGLDQDSGPILSGIAVISVSIGAQAFSFITGFLAEHLGLKQAYWMIPIGSVWLTLMVLGFSYHLRLRSQQLQSTPAAA
ncbi:MFS transporter [Pokkaliibacter plantistimulans]|uniref:MFS transporter n=1 Tax=Proteobacteria bacterium 228 TaxID=2083153 RepID=A0A2S5KP38_9PROT|nr:MFS transporter [Pokkaliibacter plantistimulans]PPC76299.1 MFS transporter [Pokkaliibacter plantistimulans]